MEPLKEENKLQVYEKNKNWKLKMKSLRRNKIGNFNTIRNKLSALSNKVPSIII